MIKKKLNLGIPCGINSEDYVNFLISTCDKTLSGEFEYEYILSVNHANVDLAKLKKIKTKYKKKICLNIKNFMIGWLGSLGHGKNLDFLLLQMDGEYGAFFDADTAFLEMNWDRILINELSEKYIIIGSEYNDNGKYADFPNVTCCVFKLEKIKKLNISFQPKVATISKIFNIFRPPPIKIMIDDSTKNIYGQPSGSKIRLDTGWQLPYKIKVAGYKGKVLNHVSAKDGNTKCIKNRGEEYCFKQVPIFTHIGRSLYRNFQSNKIVREWKSEVINWLNRPRE